MWGNTAYQEDRNAIYGAISGYQKYYGLRDAGPTNGILSLLGS